MVDIVESGGTEVEEVRGKSTWVRDIALKLIDNKPLTPDDLRFLQNMCTSERNSKYGDFLKLMANLIMQHREFASDPDTVIDNFHKNILLQTQLFKATAQQRKDGAIERSHNLNSFNKMARMMDKKEAAKQLSGHASSKVPKRKADVYVHPSMEKVEFPNRNERSSVEDGSERLD